MKNELVIILASYIGAMKGQGYQMSEEQYTRITKLLMTEKFKEIYFSFAEKPVESDSLLVDAALNFLEENLNAN